VNTFDKPTRTKNFGSLQP